MSEYRREPVEGAAPLTHTDAETLISARLDGPLDPVMNRALLAHLATCESCRGFASQMESMAICERSCSSVCDSMRRGLLGRNFAS